MAGGCVRHGLAPRWAAATLGAAQHFEQSTKAGLCGTDFLRSSKCSCSAHGVRAGSSKELTTQRFGKPDRLSEHLNGSGGFQKSGPYCAGWLLAECVHMSALLHAAGGLLS